MELQSRCVFIDTCIYQQKNFQFSEYQLNALRNLVEGGQVKLLLTDVTIREVRAHISLKSREAASAIKKLKKEAVILRNFPRLPTYSIFEDVSAEHMESQLFADFDKFMSGENVETLSVDDVSPSKIFDLYFSVSAPFAIGKKSKEFSDAFALEALNDWSVRHNKILHVISSDGDMHRYCAGRKNLVCSSNLDDFIEAVNRSYAAEPSVFADKALSYLMPSIIERATEIASSMESLIVDFFEFSISEGIEIKGVKVVAVDLMGVDSDVADYAVEFAVDLISRVEYEALDFEAEDYVFDQRHVRTANYVAPLHVFLSISIEESILERVKINSIEEYSGALLLDKGEVTSDEVVAGDAH